MNISGPSQLTTLQTGTFIALTSGGSPPYNYSWQKYQYCDDLMGPENMEEIGTRGVTCGYWKPVSCTDDTLYISGFIPAFKLRVTVTDINGSDSDDHYIYVTLP